MPEKIKTFTKNALRICLCLASTLPCRVCGTVISTGSKEQLNDVEDELEVQAADLSMTQYEETEKFYAVVKWTDDNKVSVISSCKLQCEKLDFEKPLTGQETQGKWKRQWLSVVLLSTGSKMEMESELGERQAKGSVMKRKRKHVDDSVDQSPDDANHAALEGVVQDLERDDRDQVITRLQNELAAMERKVVSEEAKTKRLRKLLKKADDVTGSQEEVKIGGTVKIPKSVDDFIKVAYQSSPMKFLKNLLIKGGMFTLEELASSSLKGGKCAFSPEEPREKLDPVKLKIAVDYTVSSLRLKEDPYKLAKFEMNMKDLCTNARKELKNSKK